MVRVALVAIVAVLALPAFARAQDETGNLMILVGHGASAARTVDSAVARLGGTRAGFSVPAVGLITVRPPAGLAPAAFARLLRALPGVTSVQPERRYSPRAIPNDPALSTIDPTSGVVQWALAKEGFYAAWAISKGDGALVGVIDSGVDATHPELASKIAGAYDRQQHFDATGTARSDEDGHGTHVASLACAATNNGIGLAGAGYNCRLLIEKTDFTDSSVVASIVDAANRHVQALNMSFGPPASSKPAPAPDAEVRALDFAAAHGVVLVAAAADTPTTEQGDPANVLQPAGTGAQLGKGIGLDVTAAQYNGARASFAGSGGEISLAAYGAFKPNQSGVGLAGVPPGIFGAFPQKLVKRDLLPTPCGCRTTFGGSSAYAYLQGTSMAAPQVAALAAMMRVLNPFATVADVIRTLKLTASRPHRSGWSSQLGWGILDAGAALESIRRLDPPVSHLVAPRVSNRRVFVLRWSAHDRRWPGLIPSPIVRYEVYVSVDRRRSRRIARTRAQTLTFRGLPGHRYTFKVVAIDRAGNRERRPATSTTRVAPGAR